MNEKKPDLFTRQEALSASLRIIIPLWMTFILFVLSIFLIFVPLLKKHMMDQKKEMIHELTDSTWSLLSEYDQRAKRGELTLEDARKRAIKRIRNLRYGPEGKDYFWINDMHPRMVMHPYFSDLEGHDLTNFADPDGKHLFVEFIKTVRIQGSGYVDYMWQWKDNPKRIVPKISYVKAFEPWGWVIGTGIYIEDVHYEIKLIMQDLLKIFTGILFIVLGLSLYITWQAVRIEKKRGQSEKALRENEEKFRSFVENANSIVYSLSFDGVFSYVSANWTEILGHDLSEIIGKHFEPFVHPDDFPVCRDFMEKVLSTGEKQSGVEYRVKHKDGGWRWHTSNSSPIKDNKGRVVSLMGIAHDITERKKSEKALRESEQWFKALFEASFEALFITDRGVCIDVNVVAENLFGYNRSEAIGMHATETVSPESRDLVMKNVMSGYEKSYEITALRKNGTVFPAEVQSRMFDYKGKLLRMTTLRDITERKQLKKELLQAQKMEAIGTLAGGIAHDFNNILSPIVGYTEMVHMNLPDGGRAKANLGEVLAASERAKDLVTQILTFGRKTHEEKKPLDIAYIVDEALKFMRSSLPSTIEIKPHVKKDCGTVMADYTQIHQVVMNLCTNAFHAMREDGGVLKVSLTPIELGPENMPPGLGLNSGPHIKLTIGDTGCGIEPDVMDRIFEPYFTTREVGEGTGMGLAVSHAIVAKHHGAICVKSEPGKGTVFDVYLPVAEKMSARQEALTKTPVLAGDERILLVDDEAPVLEMIAQMLETMGYSVWPMTSSKKALEAFMASPDEFDLVFTDMTMPHMTGDVLAKKILEISPEIPVILCTGFSEKITQKKAKEIGIAAFVTKPVAINEIATAIREVLDKN